MYECFVEIFLQRRCEIMLFLFLCMHRFIESNWFVWVTQMNHIPMHIDYDKNVDWFSTQVRPSLCVTLEVKSYSFVYVTPVRADHRVMGTERRKQKGLVLAVWSD